MVCWVRKGGRQGRKKRTKKRQRERKMLRVVQEGRNLMMNELMGLSCYEVNKGERN